MASYVHSAWMRTKDIRVFVPIYCGRRWLLVRAGSTSGGLTPVLSIPWLPALVTNHSRNVLNIRNKVK